MASSFQETVVKILTTKTFNALKEHKINNLLIAGGVSANSRLREVIKEEASKNNIKVVFPEHKYCTDNATMIATAAYFASKAGKTADLALEAGAQAKIS